MTRRALLLGALALFAATRLPVLVTSSRALFYWEETVPLLVARELLAGPRLPLLEYEATHYQGGPIVTALLAVPAVFFRGTSLTALKLVPLAFAAGALALWTSVLRRLFGRGAAALFVLLYCFAPPAFVLFNFLAIGTHPESVLFSALLVWLAVRLLEDAGDGRVRAGFVFGCAAGFGLWYDYATAVTLAALVPLALTLRADVARTLPTLAGGFVVGFSPWIYYNVTHPLQGLVKVREVFAGGGGGHLAATLANLPRSLVELTSFGPALALSARAWSLAYATGLALGVAAAGVASRAHRAPSPSGRGRLLVIGATLLQPALTFAVYLASSLPAEVLPGAFPFRVRVLVFMYPFLFAGAAVGLAEWLRERGTVRLVALLAAAALLGSGAVAWGTLLGRGRLAHSSTELQEIGCMTFGFYAVQKYPRDPSRGARDLAALHGGRCRDRAFAGLGWGALVVHAEAGRADETVAAFGVLPSAWRAKALEGFAYQAGIAEAALHAAASPEDAARLGHIRAVRARLERCIGLWPRVPGHSILPTPLPCAEAG